jgi:hypothetical protein
VGGARNLVLDDAPGHTSRQAPSPMRQIVPSSPPDVAS